MRRTPAAVRRPAGTPRSTGTPRSAQTRRGGWSAWRRLAAVAAVLVGLLAGGVALAVPAQAHAELASADPADSARLDRPPGSVTLRFSESVGLDLGYLRVVDRTGRRVDTGQPEHPGGDPTAVSVRLRAGLGDGSYVVSWRVLSADSHPVAGAYAFVVGDGPLVPVGGAAPPASASVDGAVRVLFGIARWAGFAGLVLLVGGAAFLVLAWPEGRTDRRAGRLVWTGWGLAAGSTALSLSLESLYASGQGLARAFDPALLSPTLHSNYGRMLSLRLVALAVLALVVDHLLDRPPDADGERSWQIDAGAVVSLAVFGTYAASGHAATGIQPPLAVLSDTLHLAAMAAWIGGLAMLAVCALPRAPSATLARTLPAFSRIAVVAVAILVVTGSYQTWREVGTLPALWSTGYGRLLSVKLAGFLALVALGYVSHLAVRRRYVLPTVRALAAAPTGTAVAEEPPGEPPAVTDAVTRSRMRRSVAAEAFIAAAVLALTVVLINQAPGRQTYSTPLDTTLTLSGGVSVRVELTPARRGANQLTLFVHGRDGRLVDPRDVTATVALPARRIGPLSVKLRHAGVGHYTGVGLSLPDTGTWRVQVSVRSSEFDESSAATKVTVR